MNYILYFLTIVVLILFSYWIRRNPYDHHKGFWY